MIVLVPSDDREAARNVDNVLAMYDLMVHKQQPEEAAARFFAPAYIQHNPLSADGADALGRFFAQIVRVRRAARVDVHRIIAVADHVWAHVNFVNFFNDDPVAPASPLWMFSNSARMARSWSIGTCCRSSGLGTVRRTGWGRTSPL